MNPGGPDPYASARPGPMPPGSAPGPSLASRAAAASSGAVPRGAVARSQHANAEAGKKPVSSPRRLDGLRAVDVMPVLQEQLAILSGGRDRRGGAVLTFQATPRRERAKPEDFKLLLQYLFGVPCDDVRDLAFSVIVDLRGSTWSTVKPILKILQENFANNVHTVFIIKPDNFWQKQRTNLGSQKYKFEANPISIESLHKLIDPSQLTTDLDGTLHYDHSTWIELRCALEDFLWQSTDMLDRLEDMREDLNHNDFADEVNGAKKARDLHNEVKRKILKIPVENIDNVGQRILQRLSTCESGNSYDSGYSGRDSSASNMTCNPDMQSSIPQIMQLLDQVHCGQQQLLQLWQIKKTKLDQCLQLRLFEQDCEKMFDWIYHNRDLFANNYVAIGHSFQEAKKLQEEHNHFTMGSNNVFSNINRILSDAAKLIEGNHYASSHVRSVAARLDKTWKDFAGCLDERTTVLALSVLFHQKAEQYVESVPKWSQGCETTSSNNTTDIATLESSIHHHQSLYENMCQSYTEVHSTSKKLLYQLDHLVQLCNQTGEDRKHSAGCPHGKKQESRSTSSSVNKDPSSDYSEGASHVLAVIHDILAHHRALESKWHAKKIKLHQRLALRLFQEDVKQVLDWLQNHGEVFLRKNVGIGRTLQKAKAYQKSHETFEGVVQNTYTNAEKLLAAAAELAQTGECNAEDIYSVAHELESHISSFAQRVEQRRRLLELAILFYSHTEELSVWLTELKQELKSEEVADSLDGSERLIDQFTTQRDSTLDACASTIAEGKTLVEELKSHGSNMDTDTSGSSNAVQSTLERLISQRDELAEFWNKRKLRLDLGLQLRLFERDALELSSQYELWAEQLQSAEIPAGEIKDTEAHLRNLAEHLNHIQTSTYEVAQRGQELLQHFESSGINVMADSQSNGPSRVQVLLEYIQEREIDLEDLGAIRRIKLEQKIQLSQFETDANQVIRWIQSAEGMLAAGFSIPGSLADAEQLKKEHEQFQTAIEKTHASAVHVRQRAENLLTNNHYDPKSVKDIADGVTTRWQGLVTRAEERHKLVTASLNFYKTAEQVCSVLDSLEREYKREDDWLARHSSDQQQQDRVTLIAQLLHKHQEQKEAFLKACTLARRTAETFLKYSNRSLQYFSHSNESTFRGPEAKVKVILEKLLNQENRVLEYWTSKKKRLDQNQQFCLFERSARQSLTWIKEEGDIYLNTHTQVGNDREETERLLNEHNSFKEKAKETREKVKLLLQLADTLVDKGHAHAPSIKQWVEEVDATYKDFSTRMDSYRNRLEKTLGQSSSSTSSSSVDLSVDRNSDPSLESKLKEKDVAADLKQIKEFNEEKRRSARRKEFIMAELMETERSYVKDLESAINCFLKPMQLEAQQQQQLKGANNNLSVPVPLRGKERIIFGNLQDIYNFHKETFLKELEKYETMPEDVGHCFVTWAQKFDIYVQYCTNKPHSTHLLVQHGGQYFEKLQRKYNLEHPIAAYLIKPVQRITKYQLLLKDLLSCCDSEDRGEIKEGLEVCLNVPKKANDALHLNMLEGCDVSLEELGEVVLQDVFQVVEAKQILKKTKERHMFLFDLYLVISKEVKDSTGKTKYIFKSKFMKSEIGITEHVEGDECKFAVWTGRTPSSETKIFLKASSIDVKHNWVKRLREMIQETYFNTALPSINTPGSISSGSHLTGSSKNKSVRISRDLDDGASLDGNENVERGSLASFGSGTTTDSENQVKGCDTTMWVIQDFTSTTPKELSITRGQQLEVVDQLMLEKTTTSSSSGPSSSHDTTNNSNNMVLVRLAGSNNANQEGLVPLNCLKVPPGGATNRSHRHNNSENEQDNENNVVGGSSPSGKQQKKGFSGKWLPNIRKLSQSKLSNQSAAGPSASSASSGLPPSGLPPSSNSAIAGGDNGRINNRQLSKNKFKLSTTTTSDIMGNKQSHSESEDPSGHAALASSAAAGASSFNRIGSSSGRGPEEGEDPLVEVPPPMQPISSVPLAANDLQEDPQRQNWSTPSDNSHNTTNCDSYETSSPAAKKQQQPAALPPVSSDPLEIEKTLEQRQYRLVELLESEKTYVTDLQQCVEYIKFMRKSKEEEEPEIPMPEGLKDGKDRMVFGNIEAIFEWHRDFFLKNLEKCIENPVELGNLFKKYDRKFQMYVVYCQNKPKSEFIVSEYIDNYFEEIRLKLGFKLRLTDLLIKPIQRLTKYHMLLEAILKYSQRSGMTEEATAIAKAFHVMTVVPNQANDMMDIGRLQGFEGKITAQGKLLHRGPLLCLDTFSAPSANAPPKMKGYTVFLFEQIMIFSETVGKKTQFTSPVYVYKAHFLVNKMALDQRSEDGDPLKFVIRSNDPARDELKIVCQAEDPESKDQWCGIMKKQLQTQMDFLRALQAPIAYHSKLAKDHFKPSDSTQIWELEDSPPLQIIDNSSSNKDNNKMLTNNNNNKGSNNINAMPNSTMTAKRNFLEGFKHSLSRQRLKQDFASENRSESLATVVQNIMEQNQKDPSNSNGNSNKDCLEGTDPGMGNENENEIITIGSIVHVRVDFKAVKAEDISVVRGDQVRVTQYDAIKGYKVSKNDSQGWVPHYVLHLLSTANTQRKSTAGWNFRKFRKPSFSNSSKKDKEMSVNKSTSVSSVSTVVGETAVLKCPKLSGKSVSTTWTKDNVTLDSVRSRKYAFENGDHQGMAILYVSSCDHRDGGEYRCVQASQDYQTSTNAIILSITDPILPPDQPSVVELRQDNSALIGWASDSTETTKRQFTLESCKLHSNAWKVKATNISENRCLVPDLEPGETYGFRIYSHLPDGSEPSPRSLPSHPLVIPKCPSSIFGVTNPLGQNHELNQHQDLDAFWQRDFERQFIELEELGRGRFGVVRRCQQILTGTEVAVKFLNRRKQGREDTRREFEILNKLRHENVVSASGLFLTATSDAIVMTLINGSTLFEYLCRDTKFSEWEILNYMTQVLKALNFIHSKNIIHLDLKPENLLLDIQDQKVKLIDFGSSKETDYDQKITSSRSSPPDHELSSSEFLAPEVISNGPKGTYTDMWCFGVLLYVSLSGLSPFLDDSDDETVNNILRCDYSFPAEYFKDINEVAKNLISKILIVNPHHRNSAAQILESSLWLNDPKIQERSKSVCISSTHLSTLVRRRMKKLNTVAPMGLHNKIITGSKRPESLYKS